MGGNSSEYIDFNKFMKEEITDVAKDLGWEITSRVLKKAFPEGVFVIDAVDKAINIYSKAETASEFIESEHLDIWAVDEFLFDMLDEFHIHTSSYSLDQIEKKMGIASEFARGIHYYFNSEMLGVNRTYWNLIKELKRSNDEQGVFEAKIKNKFMQNSDVQDAFYRQYLSEKTGVGSNILNGLKLKHQSKEVQEVVINIINEYIDNLLSNANELYNILSNYFEILFCKNTIL